MNKYLCVMKQIDDGCGNSIRCGINAIELNATSLENAKSKAIERMYMQEAIIGESDPSYYIDGEGALLSWKVYEIGSESDMMDLLQNSRKKYLAQKTELENKAKLEQFERLKKELGK